MLAAAIVPRFKQLKFLSDGDVASVKDVSKPEKQKKTALDVLLGSDTEAYFDDTPKGELATYFSEAPSPCHELSLAWW